jgi:hypothetical protein
MSALRRRKRSGGLGVVGSSRDELVRVDLNQGRAFLDDVSETDEETTDPALSRGADARGAIFVELNAPGDFERLLESALVDGDDLEVRALDELGSEAQHV